MKHAIGSSFSLLCLILFAGSLFGQTRDIDRQQAFLDLTNDEVIMDLSAHPDDEDGATLAYYRMKYGVRTYSVLFTRGEGGQNEIGPELYEDLGVIRTDETRQAGKILGTEVIFLDLMDFGFSKTATETFQIWGGQTEVLRRLVYVIRKYKPDILFTNHNTIDGHGNHQAVAITAIAAFDAAADSTIFPEQLRELGVTLWQPRKLFFRTFRRDGQFDVSNDVDQTDPLRDTTYLDIATFALRQHRTQGMERANLRAWTRGRSLYKLMRSNSIYDLDTTSFFSGIDLWRDPSISPLRSLRTQLSAIVPGLPRDSLLRAASVSEKEIGAEEGRYAENPLASRLLMHWDETLRRVVALSCGISMSGRMRDTIVVPGEQSECTMSVGSTQCTVVPIRWTYDLPVGWSWSTLRSGSPPAESTTHEEVIRVDVGSDARPTVPRAVYQYKSLFRSQAIMAHLLCTVDGQQFTFSAPVPVDVAPAQSIRLSTSSIAYIPGRTHTPIAVRWTLHNWEPARYKQGVFIADTAGWQAKTASIDVRGGGASDTGMVLLEPPKRLAPGDYTLRVQSTLVSAPLAVHVFDASVRPNTRVGIVESYDNTLEEATALLNVPSKEISDDALSRGDLSQYSAIIIDIRAYLARNALKESNARLLDYVHNGGTLIVMYQKDQEWKPQYAPYPFAISHRRVTREDAPVTILAQDDPLMTTPNRIGPTDWLNWKQERGLYFPEGVPKEYTRVLSCGDPDEEPLTTGYLRAAYGKGQYVYTSYVWYRELKEGNPGAYRCFANMISLRGGGSNP